MDAGGTDTVRSTVDFTLGNFVEKLELKGGGDLMGLGDVDKLVDARLGA